MTDRRLFANNGRAALSGFGSAERISEGAPAQITTPVADLRVAPSGARDRQLLFGAPVTVIDADDDWSFIQAECGYVGYVPNNTLTTAERATHVVRAKATHVYTKADLKSPEIMALPYGARVKVQSGAQNWAQISQGWLPMQHLAPVTGAQHDPVAVAELFLGTPYLWGGNSIWGLDCSGLVQTAMRACGIACLGDADLQEKTLGRPLSDDDTLDRGDLIFWKGHVGVMASPDTLLHANAHTMSVAYEPFDQACARIEAAGDGKVTARKRVL